MIQHTVWIESSWREDIFGQHIPEYNHLTLTSQPYFCVSALKWTNTQCGDKLALVSRYSHHLYRGY